MLRGNRPKLHPVLDSLAALHAVAMCIQDTLRSAGGVVIGYNHLRTLEGLAQVVS